MMPSVLLLLCLVAAGQSASINEQIVRSMVSSYKDSVDENTVLTEYDILVSKDQWQARHGSKSSAFKAVEGQYMRWTDKTIPYVFKVRFDSYAQREWEDALTDWQHYTCIKFTPYTDQKNWIEIKDNWGCSSYVGMMRWGAQPVSLARGCKVKAIILHELGHAIGFQHEQCRSDRDESVKIHLQNVSPGMRYNFDLLPTQNDAIPYDYMSIMHYDEYSFSMNGRKTIEALDPKWQSKMGNAAHLSYSDVKHANLIYKCGERCGGKVCKGESYLDKHCRCMCPSSQDDIAARPCEEGGEVVPTEEPVVEVETTPIPPAECIDRSEGCPHWAKFGYCQDIDYKPYMRETCPLSCGYCS